MLHELYAKMAAQPLPEGWAYDVASNVELSDDGLKLTMTATPKRVPEVDEIAGDVYPSPSGACDAFAGDGRSDRCVRCDWRSGDH